MDVAALALNIDSSKVAQAANDLDRFAASSDKAAASSAKINFGNQSGSIAKLVAAVQSMDNKLTAIVGSLDRIASATKSAAVANDNMTASVAKTGGAMAAADAHVIAYTQHLAGLVSATNAAAAAQKRLTTIQISDSSLPQAGSNYPFGVNGQGSRSLAAAQSQQMRATPTATPALAPAPSSARSNASAIGEIGTQSKLAAHEVSNLAFQLNDVFVGLASGQHPLTVFIQQGSQIAQIPVQAGKSFKEFGVELLNTFGIIKRSGDAGLDAAAAQASMVAQAVAGFGKSAAGAAIAAGAEIELASAQAAAATTAVEQAAAATSLATALQAQTAAEAEAAVAAAALASANEAVAATAVEAAEAESIALAPLGVAIAVIVAALGLFVAGLAALKSQANDDSGLKKFTTAMGYSKEEVLKLNAVTVSFGDTFKAVFQVGFERIASAFGLNASDIKKVWNDVLEFLATATRATIAGLYALFTGLAYTVQRTLENIKGGKMENPFTTLTEGYKSAYGDAQKFMDDVTKQARANAQKRQSDMAKAMYDAPHHRAAKKDPLTGILQGAQDEINTELTRAAAIGLSARAATEMEQRTKLLNQIQKAGIPITDGLRAKVDALSKAYADAKVAADAAAAVQGVIDGLEKQGAAINDQIALVGAYGDALTKSRMELEALTAAQNALPKGETLSDADSKRILAAADKNAADQAALDHATRTEKVRKDAEDAMYAMKLEAAGMGLAGASALAWTYAQERLNEAQREGRTLSADDIAQIQKVAEAYGNARYAIDQQTKALADSREVTKGFFTDWINGVREGGNLFKTFADSVVNSLNRIIDKLLDRTLNGFLDNMFAGGGGLLGSLFGGSGSSIGGNTSGFISNFDSILGKFDPVIKNAMGGIYGAQRFANGGAFTNSIVNTPTLFRFANGGKMGEMGEAGPEAIMPLKRGPNGALGVQMHGGSRPSIVVNTPITIAQSGSFTTQDAQALAIQAGKQAVQEVKRNLDAYLREWDTDGAVST